MMRMKKMKTLLQTLVLTLSACLLAGSLLSCSNAPSPDNIYQVMELADSAKMVMTMEVGDSTLTTITSKIQGNIAKMTTVIETMGKEIETVTYLETVGDTEYLYAKDAQGNWIKTEADTDSNEGDFESFKELYNSKNYQKYDRKSCRYYMKEDVKIEMNGTTYSDGYLEIGKDEDGNAYYELYVKTLTEANGKTVEGAMTIVLSDIGKVEVSLPTVDKSDQIVQMDV